MRPTFTKWRRKLVRKEKFERFVAALFAVILYAFLWWVSWGFAVSVDYPAARSLSSKATGVLPWRATGEDLALWSALEQASWQLWAYDSHGHAADVCTAGAYWSDGNKTRLLTAGHCTVGRKGYRYFITKDRVTFHEVRVLARGWFKVGGYLITSKGDWAILEVDGGYPSVPLGTSSGVETGMAAYGVSYPLGADRIAVHGIVSNPHYRFPGIHWDGYIALDMGSLPGSSGTTLVLGSGRIFGILVASAGRTFVLATPIDLVRKHVPCLDQDYCLWPWL